MNCQINIPLIKYTSEVYITFMIRIKLDETLKKYNITRYELAKRTGIQYQIIDNYYKNTVKRYDGFVLERICKALDCRIEDVLEYSNTD